MRSALADAERRFEVREAARGWQRAGAIDEATRGAIEVAYPDDRRRLGPAFRVLVFGFTLLVATSVFSLAGLFMSVVGERGGAVLLTVFGVLLAVATEVQIGRLRLRQGGSESATAFLAVGYLLFGLVWLVSQGGLRGEAWMDVGLGIAVVVCGAAGWRWGYTLFTALATAALFVLAARGPFGRLAWIAGGLVLAPLLARAGESGALAPAHRRGARAASAVALVFVYLAVHRGSWDSGLVEMIAGGSAGRPSPLPLLATLSAVATGVVPVVVLVWGVRTRRRWLLALGVAGIVASLVTLRHYVHVAPPWIVLLGAGGATLALAAVLRRYLHSGAGHERAGLTAEPLFTDVEGHTLLEMGVTAAMAGPDVARPAEAPSLQPGGGRYGGGGASGTY